MNGFRVETIALAESGTGYRNAALRLADSADRLREAQRTLQSQEIDADIAALLSSAELLAYEAAAECRELNAQCEEIAQVYELTERRVASIVQSLPQITAFTSAVNHSLAAMEEQIFHTLSYAQAHSRVDSRYNPTTPVMLSSNRLPCESWLLDRAIRKREAV